MGPAWTGVRNLFPTGVRPTNRLACSESLYRLRYPGHNRREEFNIFFNRPSTPCDAARENMEKVAMFDAPLGRSRKQKNRDCVP